MWRLLKRAQIPLRVGAAITAVYLGYVLLARHTASQRWVDVHRVEQATPEAQAKFDATYGGSAVKIVQFYARDGAIMDDQRTLICYGVLNAKSLKIDPPVAEVYPALNRCVEAAPQHDTKYTLTAVRREDGDGRVHGGGETRPREPAADQHVSGD